MKLQNQVLKKGSYIVWFQSFLKENVDYEEFMGSFLFGFLSNIFINIPILSLIFGRFLSIKKAIPISFFFAFFYACIFCFCTILIPFWKKMSTFERAFILGLSFFIQNKQESNCFRELMDNKQEELKIKKLHEYYSKGFMSLKDIFEYLREEPTILKAMEQNRKNEKRIFEESQNVKEWLKKKRGVKLWKNWEY